MSYRFACWTMLPAVAFCCLTASAAAQDAELLERFLKEAPPAWEKFDAATKYAQGSIESTMRMDRQGSDEGAKTEFTFLIDYALNESCSAIELKVVRLDGGAMQSDGVQAFVRNPNYVLELERASADEPWQTKHAGEDWSDAGFFTPTTSRGYGEMPLMMGRGSRVQAMATLSECVVNPSLSIQDIEVTPNKTWRIKFTFDRVASPKFVFERSTRGVLECDPEHNWRQVRGEFNDDKGRSTCEFKYPDGDDAQNTLPSSHVYTHYRINKETGDLVEHVPFRYAIELAVPNKLPPDSDFSATAFGLEEPEIKARN